MKSRYVLTIMSVVFLAFSVKGECKQNTTKVVHHHRHHRRPHPGIVELVIHGPTITAPEEQKTTIVEPKASDAEHFLLNSPYPSTEEKAVSGSCREGAYVFTLEGAKRETNQEDNERVLIDPSFGLTFFKVENWKPLEKENDYFMVMHLPGTRKVRAVGPPYQVQFAGSSKPSLVPLTEILEFPVRDMDAVRLARSCGKEKKIEKPLSCREMHRKYREYFQKHPMADSPDSQRPYIEYELQGCSENTSYLFVGIGLDPTLSHDRLEAHGRNFFNRKILPEIYGGEKNVPEGRKIVEKGYSPGNGYGATKVRLIHASFVDERSLYVPAAMTENCTSPGAVAGK